MKQQVDRFNALWEERDSTTIPNDQAYDFLASNIPLFECPDTAIEEIYYFRWWTYRKHIRNTPSGFVITQYVPEVEWASDYNTIQPVWGYDFLEGRWLKDRKYLDNYSHFWFREGIDAGGIRKYYSFSVADALYNRFLVTGDSTLLVSLLDGLIANYENWGKTLRPGPMNEGRLLSNGMYWQIDSWEGSEFSIGGDGMRLPINSYMYGDAKAISMIADMVGRKNVAAEYRIKAHAIKTGVQNLLWDRQDMFFKTMRTGYTQQYKNHSAEPGDSGKLVSVREIFGYVPWQYNLPDDTGEYASAWRFLNDTSVFFGEYSLRTADKGHPGFSVPRSDACKWNGSGWPFSTSQTLVELANLLNNYNQDVVTNKDYAEILTRYAHSHYFRQADGTLVPWIDESLNPETGQWILFGDYPQTRGRFYNHSTYCDLVITGLVGLRPAEGDTVIVNPLIPEDFWEWFCLENIPYHGNNLSIYWDKNGKRYGKGKGLNLFANEHLIASSPDCRKITGILPKSLVKAE